MRIDGSSSNVNWPSLSGPKSLLDNGSDTVSPSPPQAGEVFQPTGDVQDLLAALRQTPSVRADVVANVTARLDAGELNTPQAKAETVNSILGPTPG